METGPYQESNEVHIQVISGEAIFIMGQMGSA